MVHALDWSEATSLGQYNVNRSRMPRAQSRGATIGSESSALSERERVERHEVSYINVVKTNFSSGVKRNRGTPEALAITECQAIFSTYGV